VLVSSGKGLIATSSTLCDPYPVLTAGSGVCLNSNPEGLRLTHQHLLRLGISQRQINSIADLEATMPVHHVAEAMKIQ
jgi:hypothetical protein